MVWCKWSGGRGDGCELNISIVNLRCARGRPSARSGSVSAALCGPCSAHTQEYIQPINTTPQLSCISSFRPTYALSSQWASLWQDLPHRDPFLQRETVMCDTSESSLYYARDRSMMIQHCIRGLVRKEHCTRFVE